MTTAGEVEDAARNCFAQLLTAEEMETLTLAVAVDGFPDEPLPRTAPVDGDCELVFSVQGEEGALWIATGEDVDAFMARLRYELQTFIAVSGFGWGEARE